MCPSEPLYIWQRAHLATIFLAKLVSTFGGGTGALET
jgi:hypothetical protein